MLSGDAGALVNPAQGERAIAVQLLQAKKPADIEALTAGYKKQQGATDAAGGKYRLTAPRSPTCRTTRADLFSRSRASPAELPSMRNQVAGQTSVPLSIAESRYVVVIADLLEHPRPVVPAHRGLHAD